MEPVKLTRLAHPHRQNSRSLATAWERTALEAPPPATCKNVCWCFLPLFLIAAGCSENQPVDSEFENRFEKETVVGHLIGKSAKVASQEEVQFQTNRQQSTALGSLEQSQIPRLKLDGIADHRPPIMAIQLPDHTLFGVPIGLFSNQTVLMRNDGSIQRIKKSDIVRQSVLSERFQSIDRNELIKQLRTEFGRNYTIRNENPYLIVARPEHIEAWTQRFRSEEHTSELQSR